MPGTPRSLLLQSRDSRSITLRWSTPFVSSEASDEYIIQWQIKETGLWVNDTSLFTNYTILNVIPATVYLVRVASSSSLGISPFTEVLYVETLLEGMHKFLAYFFVNLVYAKFKVTNNKRRYTIFKNIIKKAFSNSSW